ncbi:hypothetical protein WN51_12132 [Melipona quadrifasciata]|uniref:Uncharacterized protein n=1 Tax=Melipona quadrifasciata TaxID=166423 RepID=A0A0N0U6C0_9HYME|nr:hypothetical protein WN51_12132 [Melipona quadrifasciata]
METNLEISKLLNAHKKLIRHISPALKPQIFRIKQLFVRRILKNSNRSLFNPLSVITGTFRVLTTNRYPSTDQLATNVSAKEKMLNAYRLNYDILEFNIVYTVAPSEVNGSSREDISVTEPATCSLDTRRKCNTTWEFFRWVGAEFPTHSAWVTVFGRLTARNLLRTSFANNGDLAKIIIFLGNTCTLLDKQSTNDRVILCVILARCYKHSNLRVRFPHSINAASQSANELSETFTTEQQLKKNFAGSREKWHPHTVSEATVFVEPQQIVFISGFGYEAKIFVPTENFIFP